MLSSGRMAIETTAATFASSAKNVHAASACAGSSR